MRKTTTRLLMVLGVMIAFGLPRRAAAQAPPQSSAQLASEAQAAMQASDYPRAVTALKQLEEQAPRVAEVHADLGIAYYFEGRFSDAARENAEALKLKPSLSHAQIFLALSLAESNHCQEAAAGLEKGFRRVSDPKLKRMLGNDGVRCAMTLNRPLRAVQYLHALNALFPNDPDILYLSSHVYSDLSTAAALRLLRTAPGSWQAHRLNAETLAIEGKVKDAAAEYRKVLALNPRVAGVHYQLGLLMLEGPRGPNTLHDARQEFEEEIKINPGNAEAAFQLGEMAFEARQWSEAIRDFREAIRIDPAIVDARIGLGKALISSGRPQEAIAPLEAAVKIEPDNAEAHYRLSFAYRLTGRNREAQHELVLYRQAYEKQLKIMGKIRTGMIGSLTGAPATQPK